MAAWSNARPHVPEVFRQIIRNDGEVVRLRDRFVAGEGTSADWRRLRELRGDRKNLNRGAEIALRWNTDKGAP